jgi:hypothetical protein
MGFRLTWLIGVTPSERFLKGSFAGMLRVAARLTAPNAFANAAEDAVHQAQIGDA